MMVILACNLHEGDMMQTGRNSGGYDPCGSIDMIDSSGMKKVYCACGCILDLDRSYFDRRMDLGKELECMHCRNLRISHELDEMNAHYSRDPAQKDSPFF